MTPRAHSRDWSTWVWNRTSWPATVEGVLAQRLVRRLCSACKKQVAIGAAELPADFPRDEGCEFVYEPVGCRECTDTGYAGRIGVFELLTTDPVLQEMCAENESATRIRSHALKNGMTTLRQSGWETGDGRRYQRGRNYQNHSWRHHWIVSS